jgi:hypothetical protein
MARGGGEGAGGIERGEIRTVTDLEWLEDREGWQDITSIVEYRRIRREGEGTNGQLLHLDRGGILEILTRAVVDRKSVILDGGHRVWRRGVPGEEREWGAEFPCSQSKRRCPGGLPPPEYFYFLPIAIFLFFFYIYIY